MGGTSIKIFGTGFVPNTTVSPGSVISIAGVDVYGNKLISVKKILATAPPGPFGPQDVMITNPGFGGPGFDRFVLQDGFGYGLPYLGQTKAASTAVCTLQQDPENAGKLLFAAAGATKDGNKFMSAGTPEVWGSFRMVLFDVSDPREPLVGGGAQTGPDLHSYRNVLGILQSYYGGVAENGTGIDTICNFHDDISSSLGPLIGGAQCWDTEPLLPYNLLEGNRDARDLIYTSNAKGEKLILVANGLSGLSILDGTDPVSSPLIGREFGFGYGLYDPRITGQSQGMLALTLDAVNNTAYVGLEYGYGVIIPHQILRKIMKSWYVHGVGGTLPECHPVGAGGPLAIVDYSVKNDPVVLNTISIDR